MSYQTLHFALIIFLCSVISLRYISTQTPPRTDYQSFSAVAQISGLPEIDGAEKTYPLRITHQFTQIKNLQHQTNIRLRSKNDYNYGDMIHINGLLTQYNSITNARTQHITSQPNPFIKFTFAIRKRIENIFYASLPHDHANLALGMTLGTNTAFSSPVEEALRKTSTMHMVVVSGFNITIITSLIIKMAGAIHRRYAIILAIVATAWFVIITGAQPPAIRAAVMATVALTAQLAGRLTTAVYALGISILLILFATPQILHNLSFQLSIAATLGIILLTPVLNELISKAPFKFLHNEIATTIGAQLAVTPLLLHTFGNLSAIAPLSNILVSWTIPFIMSATAIIAIIGLVIPISIGVTKFLLISFTAFFLQVTTSMSQISYGYFEGIKIDYQITLAVYIILVSIIVIYAKHKKYSKIKEKEKIEVNPKGDITST